MFVSLKKGQGHVKGVHVSRQKGQWIKEIRVRDTGSTVCDPQPTYLLMFHSNSQHAGTVRSPAIHTQKELPQPALTLTNMAAQGRQKGERKKREQEAI